jgi:predicted MFS family arabinose efflux permease
LLVAFIMWRRLPISAKPPARPATTKKSLLPDALRLLRKPSILAIIGAFSLIAVIFWVLFTYLPLFIFEHYHVSLESAAFQATFYMQGSAMLLMPLLGAISDRWTRKKERNRFLACSITCVLGIPALIGIGAGSHSAILIGSLILFGLVMAGTDASWLPMLCAVTPQGQRALGYGLMNAFGTLAGGCAAMITALVMKRFGLGTVIASLGALFGIMVVLLVFVAYGSLKHDRVSERE